MLSRVDLNHNSRVLQTGLENKGYFNAFAEGDTSVRGKKARATYTIKPGVQYAIRDIRYDSSKNILSQTILQSVPDSRIKPGDPFDLTVIKSERVRIDDYLKERGFFYFDSDYMLAQTGSTVKK